VSQPRRTRQRKAAALRELRKAELGMGKFVEPHVRRVMLSELYAAVLQGQFRPPV
jgi:hypothetical protein